MSLRTKVVALFVGLAILFPCVAEGQVSLGPTRRFVKYGTDPTTCRTGDVFYDTVEAVAKLCTAVDTWVTLGGISQAAADARYLQLTGGTMTGPITGTSNIVEFRNATTAQDLRVYNTWTSATNYEAIRMFYSGNIAYILSDKGSGGGTGRPFQIGTGGDASTFLYGNGSNRWGVATSASGYAFYPVATNTYDLGASTQTVRTGYFGTSVISPIINSGAATNLLLQYNGITVVTLDGSSNATIVGSVYTGASSYFGNTTRSLFSSPVDGVFVATKNDGTTGGWVQQGGGHKRVAGDATNATATPANITDLTITVVAARKYGCRVVLYANDSVAAEGLRFDFDGGTATMTSFRAHGTLFDTALLLSTQTTALATDFNAATATGDSMFEAYFGFVVNVAGTVIPRFAQSVHTTGTATIYANSFMTCEDLP